MTYIKKISMSGFKSFGDRTVTVKLSSGFTCIVGPNGAGKSNIIDALCFSLGRLSKKTMRAKSLEDLIFAGSRGKNPALRASVTLYFDNSENIFPGGTDDFEITRIIKKGGGGGYKMNGKKATRHQILNALAAANIDPDGSNQFVLQGKIVELTHMNAEDRRKFIEELIGLQKYDEMKDVTLKELEKAERDLGQFEAIFKEVSSQLRKVEREKNDALAWKELDEKINYYNAQLIALKIAKLQEEEADLEIKIEESQKIIEELDEKITRQEDLLNQESLVMENIQNSINEKENEREQIVENITQLKTQLSSNQTSFNLAKKSIEKLNNDIKNLESFQMELEQDQTFDSLIDDISQDIIGIEFKIQDSKNEIDIKQQNQAVLESKIKENEAEKSKFKAEISKARQKISSNEARIKVLTQNIKKNEDKKKKLDIELHKLKGEAESIDEAIEETKKIESQARKIIDDLNSNIQEENQKQKDLENKITAIQAEKSELNVKLTNIQSSLSSLNTEIKMNKDNINNLYLKKSSLEDKINKLSKGKDTEEVIKNLIDQKQNITKKLSELRKKSKEEDTIFRKDEKDLELLKMKKDSFESEINDNNNKITNLNTEFKIYRKELTNLERENKNLDIKTTALKQNISNLNKDIEVSNIKKENIQGRLDELLKEKENALKRIQRSEEEYDKNTDDITGILSILNMLTQNINISVESIKGNIQQSNSEAIETSGEDFRKFVLDIIDMMKILETLEFDTQKIDEMTDNLNSMLQTINLFTNNADSTIFQLINKVQESVDIAVQESTSEFDSFVQDLMEILENIHLSLRQLTMSKSQELYKQLDEISSTIKSQEDDFNGIEKKLTELNSQERYDSENIKTYNLRLDEIEKRDNELHEKIETSEKEIEERGRFIEEKSKEIEKLESDIQKSKNSKNEYWNRISKFQEEIEISQKEFEICQEHLQEVQGLQTLYENIQDIDNNILDLNKLIEEKKELIINTQKGIAKIKSEESDLNDKIKSLNKQKENFWEITGNLRKQIEEENKNVEEIMDRLRALDNVMRIINSIEELSKENEEANINIESSNKEIEDFDQQVEKVQKTVDEIQQLIDSLGEEKQKELENQKVAQKNLNNSNKILQKTQSKLNELNKNKEREIQIFNIGEEIKETEKQVELVIEKLEKIQVDLKIETDNKDEKQNELDKFSSEKDESWKKQKEYQKVLTDLKSDASMENSKVINFDSKRLICTDQIEAFYQRSKDYGNLPIVTDELSEEGLQSDIVLTTKQKKALEPVNLKAIEEFDIIKERFDEIDMRRQTIQRERKAIFDAIEKIDLEKTRTFMKSYHEINREFSRIFQKLSPGGSAKMMLDRPDKPFEGGVSIEARPRGKKISSLEILSGGEKTLVALSFIFAVQEFYPAPFYVLDEIDAALDGPNVHRVSMLLKEFAAQSQFLVISHREENIVNADRIYGVAMQQSGITDIFSVDLEEEAKILLELEDTTSLIEGL
ncbi:hypothetical protein LCGC14_0492950 [marine sediment metagenome]|uniref:RecF/RecN/SMC N-terminal domain-containing protein n=1 Tax=marine sediment metagenome TaxID=412755 RepID=A0A0F9SPI9_9ZZZZ|nr:MAG: hypothetical protein Lokiarch_51020 [Candidatus Lokiarchaeum sp. GC14_75]